MYNKNAMFILNEIAFGRNEIHGLPLFMKMWNKLLVEEKKREQLLQWKVCLNY